MKTTIKHLFFLVLFLGFYACEKDEPKTLQEDSNLVEKANELLSGKTVVLNTTAKMGSVDKTLLKEGCPVKYTFTWNKETKKIKIKLEKFQVGNMPFGVAFHARASYSELNQWEKEEYKEKGWVKFYADDGNTDYFGVEEGEEPLTKSGIVEGYVNPLTQEITFFITYNTMGVKTFVYPQKIDFTRLANFEKEFKQYEKDLKKYKEEHGL